MKKIYLYRGTVKSEFAPDGIFRDVHVAITGHTQATQALAAHFRVNERDVKIKVVRDANGNPLEILAGIDEIEQCWADIDDRDRCQNKARAGFHTCKIHTSFDAPAPFGTPEYETWVAKDLSEILSENDSKPAKRRSGVTTPKTRRKPAKRRAAPRDELK